MHSANRTNFTPLFSGLFLFLNKANRAIPPRAKYHSRNIVQKKTPHTNPHPAMWSHGDHEESRAAAVWVRQQIWISRNRVVGKYCLIDSICSEGIRYPLE